MRGVLANSIIVASLTFGGLSALATGASAQSIGVNPGWNGYSPGYAWGSVGPSVGGVAPQPYGALRTYYNSPSGWQGYAPATAWQGYDPGTAWRYYTPGTAAQPGLSAPVSSGTVSSGDSWYRGKPISSSNREFGTGRNVHMIKPWMPRSPR